MMCFDELEEVNGIYACLELQNDQAENIKNTYENSAKYYSPLPNKHTYTFIVFCKFGSPYMPN